MGHWPPSEVISQILAVRKTETIDAWIASFPGEVDEASVQRWLEDGTFDRESARDDIVRASLQIAASRLVGQKTQERTAEGALVDGIRRREETLDKTRRKRG